MKSKLATALLSVTLAGAAVGQVKPEDAIKWRQSSHEPGLPCTKTTASVARSFAPPCSMRVLIPQAVMQPKSESEVQAILAAARLSKGPSANHLRLATRGL